MGLEPTSFSVNSGARSPGLLALNAYYSGFGGDRTHNLRIKSPLLSQLSYEAIISVFLVVRLRASYTTSPRCMPFQVIAGISSLRPESGSTGNRTRFTRLRAKCIASNALKPYGRRGIRTLGRVLTLRRFSKPVHSASLSSFQVSRRGRIRTGNNPLRRRALYPVELHDDKGGHTVESMPPRGQPRVGAPP